MSEDQTTTQAPELVGLFDTKDSFDAAVRELRDSGFKRTDLSVLSSHESIDVAGSDGRSWGDVLTALVGRNCAVWWGGNGPGGNCGGGWCWGGGPARIYR